MKGVDISLFPTAREDVKVSGFDFVSFTYSAFAGLLFMTLIYFCLVLFTKTDPSKPPTARKLQRNMVYRVCGYIITACILLIGIYMLLPQDTKNLLVAYHPVYWLEAAAIFTFGLSWFTKGEAILKDED